MTAQQQQLIEADHFCYVGQINRRGYEDICEFVQGKDPEDSPKEAVLVLGTSGGDAHAAFRICRALHHHYPDGFTVFIPGYCKSAGTLIASGAKTLVMADQAELGPLDVQIARKDEIMERSSGLDLPQAIDYLNNEVRNTFRQTLMEIKVGGGLSTSIAADMATELTVGTFSGIFEQIDPTRIGETQRANMIAYAYGQRLADASQNLKTEGLMTLLSGYPDHSFVIDRKEARSIFEDVERPTQQLLADYDNYMSVFTGDLPWQSSPAVFRMVKTSEHEGREPVKTQQLEAQADANNQQGDDNEAGDA